MNKIFYTALIYILGITIGSSQTTAVDWTLTDCSSTTHHLYEYLDSQEVVVMEFSHGCASCTQAASYLMDIKADYDVSHPGKVNWFFMDYNGNDCSTVASSVSMYDFDAEFINCEAQKDDYYPSIFPMPAIVIAAGNYHTVIFQNLTWLNSDTLEIRNALDHFFNTVSIEDQKAEQAIVYPNPATEVLYFDVSTFNQQELKVNVYDMLGKKLNSFGYRIQDNRLVLMVYYFPKGNYILEMGDSQKMVRKVFLKE